MANELYRVDNGYGFGSSNGNITASDALTITANSINLGSNANVKISGGSNGQALTTDGAGNLSWTTASGSGGNMIYSNFAGGWARARTLAATSYATYNYYGFLTEMYDPVSGYASTPISVYLEQAPNNAFESSVYINSGILDINATQSEGRGLINILAGNRLQLTGAGEGVVVASNLRTSSTYTWDLTSLANIAISNTEVLRIPGGTSGQVLSTDGNSNLSWISAGGAGTPTQLVNGTSNVIVDPSSDISFSVGGVNNILIANSTAVSVRELKVIGYSNLGEVGNVKISGGANGAVLSTDGSSLLSWKTIGAISTGNTALTTTANSFRLNANGFTIMTGWGDAADPTNPQANYGAVFGGFEYSMYSGAIWDFTEAANITLGAVANLHISGGTSGQVLSTDGAGNLSWISAGGGGSTGNVTFANTTVQGVNGLNLSAGADFTANLAYLQVRSGDVASHIHFDTGDNAIYDLIVGDDAKHVQISSTGNIIMSAYDSGNLTAHALILDNTGNLTLPGNTFAVNYANGTQVSIGGGGTPTGIASNTAVSNAHMYTYSGNTGSEDYAGFNTKLSAYSNDYYVFGGNVYSNGISDRTSVGIGAGYVVLTSDVLTGNGVMALYGGNTIILDAPNVSLGPVANIHISGGSNGQALTTDGAGNLSWTTVSGGGASNVIYSTIPGVANANIAAIAGSGSYDPGNGSSLNYYNFNVNFRNEANALSFGLLSVYAGQNAEDGPYETSVSTNANTLNLSGSNSVSLSSDGNIQLYTSAYLSLPGPTQISMGTAPYPNALLGYSNSTQKLMWVEPGIAPGIDTGSNGNFTITGSPFGNGAYANIANYGFIDMAEVSGYWPNAAPGTGYTMTLNGTLDVNLVSNVLGSGRISADYVVAETLAVNSNVELQYASNVNLGAVANLHISGGTSGQVLSTNGSGGLSWIAAGGGGASNVIYSTIPNVANANIAAVTEAGSYNSGGMNLKYYSFAVNFTNEANSLSYGALSVNAGQSAEDGPYSKSMSTSVESLSLYGKDYVGISTDYMSNANSYIQVNTGNLVLPSVTSISMGSANAGEVIGYDDTTGRLKWVASGAASSIDTGSGNGNFSITGYTSGNGAYANIGSYNFVQMFESSMSTANGTVPTYDAIFSGRLTVNPVANVGHSGNINAGNINISDALYVDDLINCEYTANVNLGAVANVHISGGSNGQALTTNGSNTLSWGSFVPRSSGAVAANTAVTLDSIEAFVNGATNQLHIYLTSGSWQATGFSETFQGGASAVVQSWVNVPISQTGSPNGYAMSGAMTSQGHGCRLTFSDQTSADKMYRVNVIRAGTSGSLWNISMERLV